MIVEAAFGANALDAAPAWTDITTDVLEFTYTHGRQHDLAAAEPGTGQLTLYNNHRKYDPTNTASPYSPNLVVNTPIRVRATWAAGTSGVFRGFATNWSPQWPDGVHSTVIVDLIDLLGFAANVTMPESIWAMIVQTRQTATLHAWWRLGEPDGATVATDEVGNSHGAYTTAAVAAADLTAGETNGSQLFDGTRYIDVASQYAGVSATNATIEVTFLHGPATVDSTIFEHLGFGPTSRTVTTITLTSTGKVRVTSDNSANDTSPVSITSASSYDDSFAHSVAVVKNGSGLTLYVDGSTVGTGSFTSTRAWFYGPVKIGQGFVGRIDEVVLFRNALTGAQVVDHYYARSGLEFDTGYLIGLIAAFIGIAPSMLNLDDGVSLVAGWVTFNGTAMQAMAEIARVEQGILDVTHAGLLGFYNRRHTSTSVNVYSNSVTSTLPYQPGMHATLSVGDIHNDITVGRKNGITVRVQDQASVDRYGPRRYDGLTDLPIQSDLEAIDLANWLVGRYSTPMVRVDTVTFDANTAPATLFPQILGIDTGNAVNLSHQPPGGGPAWVTTQILEKKSDTVTPTTWKSTWTLSAADAKTYMTLDDAVAGLLDVGALSY